MILGLGGCISLGSYFFLDIKKQKILGVFIAFGMIWTQELTNQHLVPCGRVLILKVPYWNSENYGYKELQTLISMSLMLFF